MRLLVGMNERKVGVSKSRNPHEMTVRLPKMLVLKLSLRKEKNVGNLWNVNATP